MRVKKGKWGKNPFSPVRIAFSPWSQDPSVLVYCKGLLYVNGFMPHLHQDGSNLKVHILLLETPQEGWESGSDAVIKMCLHMAVHGRRSKSIPMISARRGAPSWKMVGLPLLHLKRSFSVTGWLNRSLGQAWRWQNVIKSSPESQRSSIKHFARLSAQKHSLPCEDLGEIAQPMIFMRKCEFFSCLSPMEPKLGTDSALHLFPKLSCLCYMSSCSVLRQLPLTRRGQIHLHRHFTDTALIAHNASHNTRDSGRCGNTSTRCIKDILKLE